MTGALARPAARLADIAPSPIRAVFDRAARLEAGGEKIYHFEIGRCPAPRSRLTRRRGWMSALHRVASARGGTPSLRVSYACPTEDVIEGLRRIVNLIEKGPTG